VEDFDGFLSKSSISRRVTGLEENRRRKISGQRDMTPRKEREVRRSECKGL